MKLLRLVFVTATFIILLSSCGDNRNSLSKIGFAIPNSAISIDENPWNLKGEETFVKATMTLAQATSLRKAFLAQTPGGDWPDSTPKKFALLPSRAAWTPRLVTKYWNGNFDMGTGHDTYYYGYLFDIKNPKSVVLYFYGVAMDD